MNATVSEWVAKAEGDYRTAQRELHATGALGQGEPRPYNPRRVAHSRKHS